jgi:hypothetical protein
MEPTPNFAAGLAQAKAELAKEGKLNERDARVIGEILDKPVIQRNGKKIRAMYRVHVRTRAMYAKLNNMVVVNNLDWTKLVTWLKEHWVEVVRIILSVVPFIL